MMRRQSTFGAVACAIALVAAISSGCGRRDDASPDAPGSFVDGPIIYDFIANFPAAELAQDTTLIDLGTSVGRGYVLKGWRGDKTSKGMTTLLGVGLSSSLRFFRAGAGAVDVSLRCLGIGARAFRIGVNRKSMRKVPLKRGWREYTVRLPAGFLRKGSNILSLRYEYHKGIDPLAPGFRRTSAALECDTVRFAAGSRPTAASVQGDELRVTVGERVDYYVNAPVGSGVTFSGPTVKGVADARLELWVQQDAAAESCVADVPAGADESVTGAARPGSAVAEHAIELPRGGARIMRLSFRAVAGGGARSPGSSIGLTRPILRSPGGPASDGGAPLRSNGQRTNVFIYLIDTLRAGQLGAYGDRRNVSPHIDALARDGVLFEHAVANAPWTKPSVASIFTGVWPATHNVLVKGQSLPPEAVTLAELLQAAGFRTGAVVSNGHVTDRFGFDQGFDGFLFMPPPRKADRLPPTSSEVNVRAFRWLVKHVDEQPLFLYVHTVDPHGPYLPPEEFRQSIAATVKNPHIGSLETLKGLIHGKIEVTDALIADLRALYAAEVAFNDASLGKFVDELKRLGLYDDALIFLLADHGEEFHEHGTWEHGRDVYGEVVNVPFIVKLPARDGIRGRRVQTLVQQIDVLPTILAYLGLAVPPRVEGRSVLPMIGGQDAMPGETTGFVHLHQIGKHQEAVIDLPWKLVRDAGDPQDVRWELYQIDADPGERKNVIDDHPIIAGYLRAQLRLRRTRSGSLLAPVTAVTDPDVEENLRALGYVE